MGIKRYTVEAKECVYPGKGSFIIFHEDEDGPLVLHGDHRFAYERVVSSNKDLLAALEALYSVQNGPPLLRHEAEWTKAMELAEAAIKKAGGQLL